MAEVKTNIFVGSHPHQYTFQQFSIAIENSPLPKNNSSMIYLLKNNDFQ
jgi:hypothetical protein